MADPGVGRLLVASLHQGIAEVLPDRLDFYEAWLNPSGLRQGRIGLAPLAAVLSFLRQEGPPYDVVADRAGVHTAEWVVQSMSPLRRRLMLAAPSPLRRWLVLRLAKRIVRETYDGSRIVVRRRGRLVHVRGSVFCGVREPVANPLCGFYRAALARLMDAFRLDVEIATTACRATGAGPCQFTVRTRVQGDPS